MTSVSIQEAQANLPDLIHRLTPGDELVITENQQPVARLIPSQAIHHRQLGTMRDSVTFIAPDFDAPLDDFREYMK
jgi:antitoxin (DNA-binding transcriptional repressor) of toxin-antitoxin stability system